jgi:hypothetical protein
MRWRSVCLVGCSVAVLCGSAWSDPIRMRHPQGWAHGYVEVTTLDGERIGVGDLLQRVNRREISSRLVLNFFDGSVDDETTVFTQEGDLRLVSDHHVQHGPSFPKPTDVLIDAAHSQVRTRDAAGTVSNTHFDMPADTYNGLASTVLTNLASGAQQARIAIVIGGDKPRLAHLKSTLAGQKSFTLGGVKREASEWIVHVELSGVAKVVAPVIGKQPPDYHVLIAGGEDPVFIREEGPLYEGGPIWRVQQVSAVLRE